MKRKTIIHASIASTAMAFMVAGTIAGISLFEKKAEKADAYTAQSSCPTTIDLKDNSASDIRNYYASLNNLSTSERQGTNLLKNLKPILKNGQKYWNYDSGNTVWQMYEIIDRDWEKSPASSVSGYNSSTNKITGYTYGTSTSSKGTNPYLHALYINRNVTNQVTAWDDHQQTQWGINREHIWAKAEGFDTAASGGARGDPMHLWAANGYANNIHSNNFFGFVNTSGATNCGTKYSNLSGNLRGTSLNLGTGTVFEPQDSDKGDIARAIFYMVARYNYYSGSDSDGIDSNNPNLVLVDNTTDWASSGYTCTTSKPGKQGILRDLLAWNRLDPPDEWEIHRNNLVYNNFSNNRNPFIDYPEWAEYIWGKPTLASNNRNITSYSTNPTGYAIPSSDSLNTFGNAVTTPTITLNKTSATLAINGTVQLTATAMGGSGNVTWTTSNSSRAQLSATSGNTVTVTGKQAGTATITATYSGKTATCSITVSATAPTVSSVTVNPATVSLDLNGTTTADLTVTVTGTNSPAQTVTWSSNKTNIATVSSTGKVTAVAVGSATITATSTVDDTKSGTCTVTVTNSGGTSTPAGTFTVTVNNNSLSSATSYANEQTTADYNGGDATASLYWGGINAKQGNLRGNQTTQTNLQSGANFYIHNTTPLPGPVTKITISNVTSDSSNYATPSKVYAKTASTTIATQSTSDSTTSSSATSATTIEWTFDESTSGKYFAIGSINGWTKGTVKGTTISVDYAATSGGSATPKIDSVTVTPSFMQLTAGETKGLTYTVAGENNPDTTVSWTSSNTSVATVDSDGNVTAKATGTATITAKSTFDTTKSGSATISVVSPSAVSGSPYMNGVPYKMFAPKYGTTTNYYFIGSIAANYYGSSSSSSATAVDIWFETNGVGQNIYFLNGSGTKQYITLTASGTYNNFTIGETAANPWIYDSANGGLSYTNSTTSYLGLDTSHTTFGGYALASIGSHVNFIAQTEAAQIGLATIIINNIVCNASGTTAPTLSSLAAWSQLGDMFSKLDSTLQQGLTDMDADEDGTIIQRAMAKYDYILGKYGTGTYSNFLNRTVINNSNKLGKTVVTNNTMLLLVVIATLGTFTFAAWFIHKKKQYDL